MSKLIPILIISMGLVLLSEVFSEKSVDHLGNEYYTNKNKFLIVILAIAMSVFVGLRTGYNDTAAYIHSYELINSNGSLMSGVDWLSIGDNPGFYFTNNILKHFGVSTQGFLMIYAVITVCIYIWFIRKYSNHFIFAMFLFVTMGGYTFTMAAIKQCVAVAFCLIATDRFIQRKYIPFVFWVLFASTFHAYSLMYLLIPFLTFAPWTSKTYILLTAAGVIGVFLQSFIGTLINITTMLGEEYDVASFAGEGVNIFRVAVVWAPILLSFMARRHMQIRKDRALNIIVNLSMVNAMIMFIALFGTANYFARLANYFLLFQTMMLPMVIDAFNDNSRKVLKAIVSVCYFLYFYYATGIMYGGFDRLFNGIGIREAIHLFF